MSSTIAMSDGDIFIRPNGQLLEIEDTTKGEQDFTEIYLTEYIPEEDYGNELFSLVGNNGLMVSGVVDHALEAISSQKIKDVVTRLQALQQNDVNSTPDERIGGITRLIVQADPSSPSSIISYVELLTESGNVVGDNTGFVIGLKQAEPSKDVALDVMLSLNPNTPQG